MSSLGIDSRFRKHASDTVTWLRCQCNGALKTEGFLGSLDANYMYIHVGKYICLCVT